MTEPWYRDGLRFRCTRCGNCCRGAGNVWVAEDEIEDLARANDMEADSFRAAFTRRAGRGGLVLRQKRIQDCVFWDADSGCTVYDARPRQCRTYPFWRGLVYSEESWRAEARSCPGIDQGELHAASEIEATAANDGIPTHRTRIRASDR